MMRLLSLLILLNICFAQSEGSLKYSLEDLKILYQQENIKEFFSHALDIRPSKRNKDWQEMVSALAGNYLKQLKDKPYITEEDFLYMEKLNSFADLKSNEFFNNDRNIVGLRYLRHCFENFNRKKCLSSSIDFWQSSQPNVDLSAQLGSLLLGHFYRDGFKITDPIEKKTQFQTSFLDIYSLSLASNLSEFYCKDPKLAEGLKNQLSYLSKKLNYNKKQMAHEIDKLMHPDCWNHLASFYIRQLNGKNAQSDLAFFILESKNALNQQQKDLYYLAYLLETPAPGDLMNTAWSRIETLSKKPTQRDLLIAEIKRFDTLPDSLLSSNDKQRAKTILRHISQNFPEFIDHYARSCLSYIKGEKKFVKGNPTIHCREFFHISKKEKFIEEHFILDFEKNIKI
jgi:hypothetical protein